MQINFYQNGAGYSPIPKTTQYEYSVDFGKREVYLEPETYVRVRIQLNIYNGAFLRK